MNSFEKTEKEISLVTFTLKNEPVQVGALNGEVVRSFWASQAIEMDFMVSIDDERYSIQAHPALLRNLLVQAGQYPVYTAYATQSW